MGFAPIILKGSPISTLRPSDGRATARALEPATQPRGTCKSWAKLTTSGAAMQCGAAHPAVYPGTTAAEAQRCKRTAVR